MQTGLPASLTIDSMRLREKLEEQERLDVLRLYDILNSSTDPQYDKLAQILRLGCHVKWSTITFVDREQQWFKATDGCSLKQTPRSVSFCSVSMQQSEPLIVEDARLHSHFRHFSTVTGEPHVRFYAGYPIFSREGYGLGSVCVNDTEPRSLSPRELSLIERGRDWVQAKLELRRSRLVAAGADSHQGTTTEDRWLRPRESRLQTLWQEIEEILRQLQHGAKSASPSGSHLSGPAGRSYKG